MTQNRALAQLLSLVYKLPVPLRWGGLFCLIEIPTVAYKARFGGLCVFDGYLTKLSLKNVLTG